ncbi:hypothetical protein TNCV_3304951 [Trichonephila clavipes]|nr:hypothetical protein TNCV_3304951 [Trichonephila clavipes]
MPDASKYTRSTGSLNQWVRKSCGLNHEGKGMENISIPSIPWRNYGGGVAIYRPFGEFRQANSYCHLYGAQGLGE